jgi:hypothetical protein
LHRFKQAAKFIEVAPKIGLIDVKKRLGDAELAVKNFELQAVAQNNKSCVDRRVRGILDCLRKVVIFKGIKVRSRPLCFNQPEILTSQIELVVRKLVLAEKPDGMSKIGGILNLPGSARNGPSSFSANRSAPARTSSSTRSRKSISNRGRGARFSRSALSVRRVA